MSSRYRPQISMTLSMAEKKKRRTTMRVARANRFAASSRYSARRDVGLLVRKSVYTIILDGLDKENRYLYYQRVYVLGKYIVEEEPEEEEEEMGECEGECEEESVKKEDGGEQSSVQTDDLIETSDGATTEATDEVAPTEEQELTEEEEQTEEEASEEQMFSEEQWPTEEDVSTGDTVGADPIETEDTQPPLEGMSVDQHAIGIDRTEDPEDDIVETLENIEVLFHEDSFESIFEPPPPPVVEESEESLPYVAPLPTPLQMALEKVAYDTNAEAFSDDKIGVLLLTMGKYCLLVIEGTEDMVGEYCDKASEVLPEFWSIDRVFAVEDKIPKCFFKGFVNRYAPTININEKFPPSVPNDLTMMGGHHWKMFQKMRGLCEKLGAYLQPKDAKPHRGEILPADDYNKLLPEVQRMEMVFNSRRFYRPILKYSRIYNILPAQKEDDAMIWPMAFNYTPHNIFVRLPFDVNLTFSDYVNRAAKRYAEQQRLLERGEDGDEDGDEDDVEDAVEEIAEGGETTEAAPAAPAAPAAGETAAPIDETAAPTEPSPAPEPDAEETPAPAPAAEVEISVSGVPETTAEES